MHRSQHHTGLRLLGLACALLGACGSSGGRPVFRTDMLLDGGDMTLAGDLRLPDGGAGDMAVAPVDLASAPDLAPAALRGLIVSGGTFLMGGVTTDDQVVVEDVNNNNALVAIPAAGGNTTPIAAMAPSYAVHAGSVFVWDGIDNNTHTGGLLLWSSERPNATRISSTSMVGSADASDDGLYVWYSNLADGSTSDLNVARWDGTSPKRVISSAQTTGACTFHWQYAQGQLFVHYCPTGSATYNVARVDPALGTLTVLRTGLAPKPFSVDKNGTRALVADANGTAYVVNAGGGNPMLIDKTILDGHILPDGNSVVLRTIAGELKRAPIQASPPLAYLVPNGCAALQSWFDGHSLRPAISPDGKWILFSGALDAKTGVGDLFISSTQAIDLTTVSMNKSALLQGDAFTADSLRTLSHRSVTVAGSGYVGQLAVQNTVGGTTAMPASGSWVAWAGTASRVAYNANWQAGKHAGRADVYVINAAAGAALATATQAEADFFLDAGKSHVLFSIHGGVAPGIYSAVIP